METNNFNQVDIESLFAALYINGKAKLSDHFYNGGKGNKTLSSDLKEHS